MRTRRRRPIVAALLVGTVAAGLAVHLLLPDGAATDVAGDVLYALAVYLVIALLVPRVSPWAVGGIAAVWGVAVELFQLTGIPGQVAGVFPPSVLILGTVFDPRDLVIAAITPFAAAVVDMALTRGTSATGGDAKLVE